MSNNEDFSEVDDILDSIQVDKNNVMESIKNIRSSYVKYANSMSLSNLAYFTTKLSEKIKYVSSHIKKEVPVYSPDKNIPDRFSSVYIPDKGYLSDYLRKHKKDLAFLEIYYEKIFSLMHEPFYDIELDENNILHSIIIFSGNLFNSKNYDNILINYEKLKSIESQLVSFVSSNEQLISLNTFYEKLDVVYECICSFYDIK